MFLGFQLMKGLPVRWGGIVALEKPVPMGEDEVWGLGPEAMVTVEALRDFGSASLVHQLQLGQPQVRLAFHYGVATDAPNATAYVELSLIQRGPTVLLRRRWDLVAHGHELSALWAAVHRLVHGRLTEQGPLGVVIRRAIGDAQPRPGVGEKCLTVLHDLRRDLCLEGTTPPSGDLRTAFSSCAWLIRRSFGRHAEPALGRLSVVFQTQGLEAVFAAIRGNGPESAPSDAPMLVEFVRLAAAAAASRGQPAGGRAPEVAAISRVAFHGELLAVQTGVLHAETETAAPGLYDKLGQLRARLVGGPALIGDAVAGAALLGTVLGHRLIRRLVHGAYDQREARQHDFRVVRFNGGWQALALEVGLVSRDWQPLQRLALAGQSIQWRGLAGGHSGGGWWTWNDCRGSRGRPGWVQFMLGAALLPGYATELRERDNTHSYTAREGRRLVPELRYEPPVGTVNGRSQGRAWTLSRLFVLEIVDRAEELARSGAVRITLDRWSELAEQARFPREGVRDLITHWGADESDTAPALVDRQGDQFALGPVHRAEHDFIVAAGRARLHGRAGGRAANARRFRANRKK